MCKVGKPVQIARVFFVMMSRSNHPNRIGWEASKVLQKGASHPGRARIDRNTVINDGPEAFAEENRNNVAWNSPQKQQLQASIQQSDAAPKRTQITNDATDAVSQGDHDGQWQPQEHTNGVATPEHPKPGLLP
jgi:hypothetical protein